MGLALAGPTCRAWRAADGRSLRLSAQAVASSLPTSAGYGDTRVGDVCSDGLTLGGLVCDDGVAAGCWWFAVCGGWWWLLFGWPVTGWRVVLFGWCCGGLLGCDYKGVLL